MLGGRCECEGGVGGLRGLEGIRRGGGVWKVFFSTAYCFGSFFDFQGVSMSDILSRVYSG